MWGELCCWCSVWWDSHLPQPIHTCWPALSPFVYRPAIARAGWAAGPDWQGAGQACSAAGFLANLTCLAQPNRIKALASISLLASLLQVEKEVAKSSR